MCPPCVIASQFANWRGNLIAGSYFYCRPAKNTKDSHVASLLGMTKKLETLHQEIPSSCGGGVSPPAGRETRPLRFEMTGSKGQFFVLSKTK